MQIEILVLYNLHKPLSTGDNGIYQFSIRIPSQIT